MVNVQNYMKASKKKQIKNKKKHGHYCTGHQIHLMKAASG